MSVNYLKQGFDLRPAGDSFFGNFTALVTRWSAAPSTRKNSPTRRVFESLGDRLAGHLAPQTTSATAAFSILWRMRDAFAPSLYYLLLADGKCPLRAACALFAHLNFTRLDLRVALEFDKIFLINVLCAVPVMLLLCFFRLLDWSNWTYLLPMWQMWKCQLWKLPIIVINVLRYLSLGVIARLCTRFFVLIYLN